MRHTELAPEYALSECGRQRFGRLVDVRDLYKPVEEGKPQGAEGKAQRNHGDNDFVALIIENAVRQCGGGNDKGEFTDLADGQTGDEAATPAVAGQERFQQQDADGCLEQHGGQQQREDQRRIACDDAEIQQHAV